MVKKSVFFLLLFPIFISLTVLIHETGHAITGKVLGVGSPNVYFWPGYEIYPNFGKRISRSSWPKKSVAFVVFDPQNELSTVRQNKAIDGIVGFMGSGLTYVISVFCLLLLKYLKPVGLIRWFLLLGALLFYDILFYSVFPIFFNLPHLIFIGGNSPEPILALEKLGVAQWISIPLVLLSSFLQSCVLISVVSTRSIEDLGS